MLRFFNEYNGVRYFCKENNITHWVKQRSKMTMTHFSPSFQYYGTNSGNFTSQAGLPLFLEMADICGLQDEISEKLRLKKQGWTDSQIVSSLLLLNIAGGDCVEDIDTLELDPGLNKLLRAQENKGMSRKQRRESQRQFRKSKQRAFPSSSALRRYLENFHNAEEEEQRLKGKAFIPASNKSLQDLVEVNRTLIHYAQKQKVCEIATLDQDATLVSTNKRSALYCYKKFKAYQPFNTYWSEQDMLLHSEFRDGNVPAGHEQKRLLEESLKALPEGVKTVLLRSDSAGYREELIRYCAEGKNKRFGVIEFAISTEVRASFKTEALRLGEEEWHPLYKEDDRKNKIKTNQEWAEVGYVPKWAGKSKNSPECRYIAIRERLSGQQSLEGFEPLQQEFPFQTMTINRTQYKIFGMVTNRTIDGNTLINWHRERCGDSEKVHCIEKADLAGGQLPSDKFGANAAWWHIMVLAFNLKALMQKFVLPKHLSKKRMKGLRFHLINIAGCVVSHARRLIVKVNNDPRVLGLLNEVRSKMATLVEAPPDRRVPI